MRGPGPRSYVPWIGIQPLIRIRSLNMRPRSTDRSRTTGNLLIGSSVIGCVRRSTSAEQDCRTLPLTSIVQAPQTSSRQCASQATGVVFLPSAVTGFRWISMRQKITFMPGTWGRLNSSQRAGVPGASCRRTRTRTVCGMSGLSSVPGSGGGIDTLARADQRRVHRFVGDGGPVLAPRGPGGPQALLVVPIGELGLVVRAPALVAHQRSQRDDSRQLEHVPELTREDQPLVHVAALVGHTD